MFRAHVLESRAPEIEKRKRVMPRESEDKRQERAREGAQAWAEYQAQHRATQEKTARLRALRLAKNATTSNVPDGKKKKKDRPL